MVQFRFPILWKWLRIGHRRWLMEWEMIVPTKIFLRIGQKYSDLLTRLKVMRKIFDEQKGSEKNLHFIIAPDSAGWFRLRSAPPTQAMEGRPGLGQSCGAAAPALPEPSQRLWRCLAACPQCEKCC